MVIVAFPPGEKYAVDYTTLDQYDYGQILPHTGVETPENSRGAFFHTGNRMNIHSSYWCYKGRSNRCTYSGQCTGKRRYNAEL